MTSYQEIKKQVLKLPINYMEGLFEGSVAKTYSEGLNYWLNVDEENYKLLEELYYKIFVFATGVDDILDNSKIRNGLPTTHVIYGMPFTLLTSYHPFIDFYHLGNKLHPGAIDLIIAAVKSEVDASAIEIYWRDQNICPSMEMFMEMTEEKAEVGRLFFKLMQLVSKNKKDYGKFVVLWTLYLILLNEYMAYETDSDYTANKTELTDITEGKFTYPVIDAIQKEGANPQLSNILKMRTNNEDVKSYFLGIVKKHKSLEKFKQKIDELREEMKEELEKLGGNPIFEKFIGLAKDVNNVVAFI